MKIPEDDIEFLMYSGWCDRECVDFDEKRLEQLREQILENQKLRELIEERQEKWKQASRMTEEQIYAFDELHKLLEKSKIVRTNQN